MSFKLFQAYILLTFFRPVELFMPELGELRPDVHPVVGLSMAGAAIVAIVGVVALSRHHPDVLARKEKRSKE